MVLQRVHEECDGGFLRRGEEREAGQQDENGGEFHGGREVNVSRRRILSTKCEDGEDGLSIHALTCPFWKVAPPLALRYSPDMSFAEVKKTIRTMPRSKRRELLTLLTSLEKTEDPSWFAELERRKKEMKAGKKISREEAMRMLGISESDLASAR